MNLIEFNNICLSLGWDKDVGYCYGDEYRLSTIYYNLNDRVDDYLVITSVNVDYITNPTKPIEEFTIYLNNIVDGKIVLVDERKYDLLYKDWDVLYIKMLIKGISDFFMYFHVGPNIKNKDLDKLLKKLDFVKYFDDDEAETWYNTDIVPFCPIILYTEGLDRNYFKPEGVRRVNVLDTVEYDIYNVYSNNPEIGHVGTNKWKCTWKEYRNIDDIEKALLAAKEKLEQYSTKGIKDVG
jgi:hypothetical protein